MKLTDGFVAKLVQRRPNGNMGKVATVAEADGLFFECPRCHGTKQAHAVLCWFFGKVAADIDPKPGRWVATGNTLEDVTLQPSVWLQSGCKWHGWVRNGIASLE